MGTVHDRMHDDLKLKNYAAATVKEYLRCAAAFVRQVKRLPVKVSGETIRNYVLEMASPSISAIQGLERKGP